MLTVIIYRKSSHAFVEKYRSMFEIYRSAGKIAFCFWDENGRDIPSALPELTELVRGEKHWRAIIALPMESDSSYGVEEEPTTPIFESRIDNPFDFLCNQEEEPEVEESQVPLIRLAQMLGGVPLVNRHYVGNLISGANQIRKLQIEKVESQELLDRQQKIWNELNDKYSFNCERPSQLYLMAARSPLELQIPTITDVELKKRHESDSSRFWYRNRYPANARFIIQDCHRSGHAHYNKDKFDFWMSVLFLAINDVPTGTFEAYKVYNVESTVEIDKIHKLLSDYYNRLDGAKLSATNQIIELKKISKFVRTQDELPAYKLDVPVEYRINEKEENLKISTRQIGMTGDCPRDERSWFIDAAKKSSIVLGKIFRKTDVILDRSCMNSRFGSKVMDDEIRELDEYQFTEMSEELMEMEKEILSFNVFNKFSRKSTERRLLKKELEVLDYMKKRMFRERAMFVSILAIVAFFLGYVPDMFYQLVRGENFGQVLGLTVAGCGIVVIVCFGYLLYYQYMTRQKVKEYSREVSAVVTEVANSEKGYTDYLSNVTSYMRGRYLLQALEKKAMISYAGAISLGRHVEHLRAQMEIICSWLKDFERVPLPDMGEGGHSYIYFDFDIPPESNGDYFLQLDRFNLSIESFDGGRASVPYPFMTGFDIKRERLYEKVDIKEDIDELDYDEFEYDERGEE